MIQALELLAALGGRLAAHRGTAGILRGTAGIVRDQAPPLLDGWAGVDAVAVSTGNVLR